MKKRELSQTTLHRRTWLEWVGASAVLSLASLPFGCEERGADPSDTANAQDSTGSDIPPPDSDTLEPSDADALDQEQSTEPFAFQPGTLPDTLEPWNVRQVDQQQVANLIAAWTLKVDGLVDTPLELTFESLVGLARQEQLTDFHCVEGWSVYDVPWVGLSFQTLLDRVGVQAAATHLTFYSSGGIYTESLPLAIAREPKSMLGYGVGGSTLPVEHGFPLRVVVPRLLGYKNAKTIERIELTDHPIDGFWVAYGYPYDGDVPAERLRPGKY